MEMHELRTICACHNTTLAFTCPNIGCTANKYNQTGNRASCDVIVSVVSVKKYGSIKLATKLSWKGSTDVLCLIGVVV